MPTIITLSAALTHSNLNDDADWDTSGTKTKTDGKRLYFLLAVCAKGIITIIQRVLYVFSMYMLVSLKEL